MRQVDLIRRRILQKLNEVRIFISCLPEREEEAMRRLEGAEGTQRMAQITDYVLQELGHDTGSSDRTARQARRQFGDGKRA